MERQQAVDILRKHSGELRRFGVSGLSLFGSTVRGEATKGSDVDLLVEFLRPVSLFEFFRLQHRLEEMLGVDRVDLIQAGALHPGLKDAILEEAEQVGAACDAVNEQVGQFEWTKAVIEVVYTKV